MYGTGFQQRGIQQTLVVTASFGQVRPGLLLSFRIVDESFFVHGKDIHADGTQKRACTQSFSVSALVRRAISFPNIISRMSWCICSFSITSSKRNRSSSVSSLSGTILLFLSVICYLLYFITGMGNIAIYKRKSDKSVQRHPSLSNKINE